MGLKKFNTKITLKFNKSKIRWHQVNEAQNIIKGKKKSPLFSKLKLSITKVFLSLLIFLTRKKRKTSGENNYDTNLLELLGNSRLTVVILSENRENTLACLNSIKINNLPKINVFILTTSTAYNIQNTNEITINIVNNWNDGLNEILAA